MTLLFLILRFLIPLIFLALGYYLGFNQYGFEVFQEILETSESFQ
jgi:hypothetical protein